MRMDTKGSNNCSLSAAVKRPLSTMYLCRISRTLRWVSAFQARNCNMLVMRREKLSKRARNIDTSIVGGWEILAQIRKALGRHIHLLHYGLKMCVRIHVGCWCARNSRRCLHSAKRSTMGRTARAHTAHEQLDQVSARWLVGGCGSSYCYSLV